VKDLAVGIGLAIREQLEGNGMLEPVGLEFFDTDIGVRPRGIGS
jgi:hypothetical protein